MSSRTDDRVLRQITRLRVRDFRGWVGGPRSIDTDADVVLLTGANGCGKTSLLEAVNLLLNGHWFDLRGERDSTSEQLNELISKGREGFDLEAEARGGGQRLSVSFERDAGGLHREGPYWERPLLELEPGPVLLARATTYFQDRIDFILRDLDRGTTLRDFLAPLPESVQRVRARIGELPDQMRREAEAEEGRLDEDREPGPAFREGSDRFRGAWESLRRSEPWLELPAAPEDLSVEQVGFSAGLAAWLGVQVVREGALSDLRRLLTTSVEHIDQRLRKRHRGKVDAARTALAAKAGELRDRLAELDRTRPAEVTERILRQFAGGGEPGLPGLAEMLRSVEVHLLQWRDVVPDLPGRKQLAPVLRELERLDVGAAGVLRASLERWLEPWQEAQRQRQDLRERLRQIDAVLGRAPVVADTEELKKAVEVWLGSWDAETSRRQRLARAERTRAEAAARRRLAKILDQEARGEGAFGGLQPLDEPVRRELARALDGTLFRFQLDPGFLPVRPHDDRREGRDGSTAHGYLLKSRDERPSYVFSTGQRGQVALAYMLAQALLLRGLLPHRVLVLDDTSTAFDLGNIVRQATWLRQLAYAAPEEERWQIFIASHHEELTNRLIELLVPPEGRELRLLRFVTWTPEKGPEIKERRARSNPPLNEERRASLERTLERSWPPWPVREVRRA